ncbi:MAG: hypothetical protein IPP28_00345 [Xanthomonadales bacterium]|nr:hypothetical protein [Xanthomonadales bacterium]
MFAKSARHLRTGIAIQANCTVEWEHSHVMTKLLDVMRRRSVLLAFHDDGSSLPIYQEHVEASFVFEHTLSDFRVWMGKKSVLESVRVVRYEI